MSALRARPHCRGAAESPVGVQVEAAEPTFTRGRSALLQRLLLKVPPLIYFGPIAQLLRSRCVLRLTTRGRRSGKPRTVSVSFMPLDDHFVIFAGFRGVNSGWYRNIRANPTVRIKVGRREMSAEARLVQDPQQRRELMRQMQVRSTRCGPPRPTRPLLKAMRLFDYQGEIDMAIAAGGTLPVIEIIPAREVVK
jgi:deazaflavin-dependent oxidoreductase (nitroreductase family)